MRSYSRLPWPRTTNQYDPANMTTNMTRARANSIYSAPKSTPITRGRTRIAPKMTKAAAAVIITVLHTIAPIIAAHVYDQRLGH